MQIKHTDEHNSVWVDLTDEDIDLLQHMRARNGTYTFAGAHGVEGGVYLRLVAKPNPIVAALERRIERLRRDIAEQEQWIVQCGGNLHGYIRTYGSAQDMRRVGDGGEAIFAADRNRLAQLRTELEMLTGGAM